jgi:hypothetical protein
MTETRKVLRVFLSSTATDMAGCREKVRDTILQLEQLPIGMETFTALPTTPAADCQGKVAQCDVVILLVAHRYGYVPSVELGGDGERSITWLEVLAAKKAGKPVYAFLIDPKAAWDQPKEWDRLSTEPQEKHPKIRAAIQGLEAFKQYLQVHCTFDTFVSEDDLARKVATTLFNHVMGVDSGSTRPAKVWRPRVCHPLQPAPNFQGRERLRMELLAWIRAPGSSDRVVSLVAVGGTGKTALAERVLTGLSEPTPYGVLVWSFYENPRTEEFLRTTCEYFTGEIPPFAGGELERLQVALSGDEPHLLVLDGLERVQAERATGRTRGELEDLQLRRLLRWLAAGQGTRARALVTSRFPLADLEPWNNSGHRTERLDDLEPAAARAVLRGWGVRGDDTTLDALVVPLHRHALSVAVLGSYLGKFCDGDPSLAPTFDHDELVATDSKAARLQRILTQYAEKLPDAERDLLARLSMFTRGVTAQFLGFVIDTGGRVSGALVGCNGARLRRLLEQLRDLGLVFRYETAGVATFTAHPFLREYFRNLLGVASPEEIHEAVRSRLAPSLQERPAEKPTDPAVLDRYEVLIEHTRMAGKAEEALRLFWAVGGYEHLGKVLGEHARGLRIVSGFAADGAPEAIDPTLPAWMRSSLVESWQRFARCLGDLPTARRAACYAVELNQQSEDSQDLADVLRQQAEVELLAGRFPSALKTARTAVGQSRMRFASTHRILAHVVASAASFRMGNLSESERPPAGASQGDEAWEEDTYHGVWKAELRLVAGKRAEALSVVRAYQAVVQRYHWGDEQARCETLLGLLALPPNPAAARPYLAAARTYASGSGHVEIQLRCYHLAAEIAQTEQAYESARCEAESGIHLADTCGFGHYSIELRLTLARVHLDAGDPKAALQRAREALDQSVHPECQYAWGEADALHLCGVAHARLGEVELARQRLTTALARRETLTHPGLHETRAELARFGG